MEPYIQQELSNYDLAEETFVRFDLYIDLIKRWNDSFHLVSRNDLAIIERRHLLDSLRLLSRIDKEKCLIDIGSGAGFPGLPLAIATNLKVLLVERNQKKAIFLKQVKLELGLNLVEVSAQDVVHVDDKDFELATMRAVAKPVVAWRLAAPKLAIGGRLLLQTGQPMEQTFANGKLESTEPAEIGWVSVVRKLR